MKTENKTIKQRMDKAEKRAKPLIEKYHKMNLDEKLKFIRDKRDEWKADHNIINRYYNLVARDLGYAKGMIQVGKELNKNKKNGCGKECRISQLTNEVLICGVSDMKGSLFYCDDCLKEVAYKCPNCKRERTQDKKVMVLCGCGYEMKEVKIKYKGFIIKKSKIDGKYYASHPITSDKKNYSSRTFLADTIKEIKDKINNKK